MKRSVSSVTAAVLGAGCLVAAAMPASAQVGVYVGSPPPAYDPYYAYDDDYLYPGPGVGIGIGVGAPAYVAPGPQVYGYVSTGPSTVVTDDDDDVRRPSRAGGCGTYRYWDGNRCRDARNK